MRNAQIARIGLALPMLAACVSLAACGGEESKPIAKVVGSPESSWVPGQAALTADQQYLRIAGRADTVGGRRLRAYRQEQKRIEEERKEAERQKRADALRRYREAIRRARERYLRALARAKEQRELQLELLRKRREEIEKAKRELAKKLRIAPGDECDIPEIAAEFNCVEGKLPTAKSKKPKKK